MEIFQLSVLFLTRKVNKMLCVNTKQTSNRMTHYPVFEKRLKPDTAISGT